MRKYPIEDWIREKVLKIGAERDRVAKELGRPRASIDTMPTLEMNQQGAYPEVLLSILYPTLSPIQDYVVYSNDTARADFLHGSKRLEVKCKRFYTEDYTHVMLNKYFMDKKRKQSDFIVVTAINDAPLTAKWFYEVGYLPTEKVFEYPVEPGPITSTVYMIPIDHFQELWNLLSQEP